MIQVYLHIAYVIVIFGAGYAFRGKVGYGIRKAGQVADQVKSDAVGVAGQVKQDAKKL